MTTFTGCGTALVTPFQKDGSLDEETLRKLVRRQVQAGINFSIIAESIDDGSSCGFIVAMQRELQAAFGVLQSSRMVVAYAAHE